MNHGNAQLFHLDANSFRITSIHCCKKIKKTHPTCFHQQFQKRFSRLMISTNIQQHLFVSRLPECVEMNLIANYRFRLQKARHRWLHKDVSAIARFHVVPNQSCQTVFTCMKSVTCLHQVHGLTPQHKLLRGQQSKSPTSHHLNQDIA